MSRWDDIATVPVYGSGNPLGVGVHHLKIQKAFEKISTKPGAEEFWIVEFEVLASNNADHAVGQTRSWVVNFKHPSAKSNVKKFVLGVTDFTEETLTPEVMKFIESEHNPLMGVTCMAEGREIMTGKNRPFTVFSWEKVAAEDAVAPVSPANTQGAPLTQ